MYWRIGSAYRKRPGAENKKAFRTLVKRGPPPGLIAFDGETAVGWCQLTPRQALPALDRGRFSKRIDDKPVWCISCFYVRRGYRGRGVTAALIEAALQVASRAGAPALEAYPVDVGDGRVPAALGYTGLLSTFLAAGFEVVHQIDSPQATVRRVIVRRDA